ncbi:MAG: molybdopterin cofactor-binding domain-containing protein, partial [Terriglobia bacterium]
DSLPHDSRADLATLHPNMFVGVDTDGTVYIIAHRSEMGTGVRTTLPLVVADELDADWKRVRIEQAIGDPRYGRQNTGASVSIRNFFDLMREAGATARFMLIAAAAAQWKVPPSECESGVHRVVHAKTNRQLGYGELAAAAAQLPVPKKEELQLKPRSAWRYIGKEMPNYDIEDICTGRAVYGMDARVDGMVYASVEHPPVLGGKVKSYDDKEALKIAGVRQTIPIDAYTPPPAFQPLGGIAVIADNTWAAFEGRKKLKIVWDNGPNGGYNSDQYKRELQETVHRPGRVIRNEGDVEAAFATGGKIVEADYYVPLLAHAPMEPEVAVAEFKDNKVTAWVPTQDPQGVQAIVSQELGIPKENVVCHVTLLGGAFGRKNMSDYAAEAAVLSKKTARPVKVVWSREDDIKFDYYNPAAAMYMKAALGSGGKPTAWLQRCAFPPIPATFELGEVYGDFKHLSQGWTDIPFDIANLRVENGPAKAYTRNGWMRSVANIYHGLAVQCFADELAHTAGRDSLDYLLDLIGPPRILNLAGTHYANYGASYEKYPVDTGRLRRVTEMVAARSGWGKRKLGKGSGLGIAAHRSFVSYVATVVEVEVSDSGQIKIPRVETVVDAGTIANPEMVRAQLEGAAVFGTSIARSCEITATNGAIDQSNFNDFPVARIDEAPYQTNVHLIESTAPPGGVGEAGVAPFVAAFFNGIFAATGTRIRELPLSKNKLTVKTSG